MKKIYINPTLEVVKINTNNQLLAGSIGVGAPGSANDAESREADFPFWLIDE